MLAILVACLALLFLSGQAPAAAAGRAQASGSPVPFGSAEPVNAVILADESGSMQQYPNEIAGEQQAAAQIVEEESSSQSQIAIYGFGSAPDQRGAQPQAAIDQYCGPTELTGQAARVKLTHCAAQIRPRTAAQGYNTDFAAALNQALTVLGAPQATTRLPLVFILTDGKLDVGPDSPYSGFGSSDAAGNTAARRLITDPAAGILHKLRAAGAEIWPVGFGQADTAGLSLFAQDGAQNGCPAGSGATPDAAVVPAAVTGSAETEAIQSKLIGAFAEARCAAIGTSVWATLPAGGSVTRTFTISPLATLASLVVDKGDPRVIVTYTDKSGKFVSDKGVTGQASSTKDGVAYVLTQQPQSPLETLRLDSPPPGPWTVTFTSPAGVPAQRAGLSVVYQGQVQLEFTDQKIGDPGHPYQLAVQPVIRSAPVPVSALAGFTAGFAVSWPDGQQAQVTAGLNASGDFAASVPVPADAKGAAHVTATAAAPGVQGQGATAFSVTPGGGLIVNLKVPPGSTVAPGGTVTVHGTIDTNGAPATSIVFSLGGLSDGVQATLASPRGTVQVGSGNQPVTVVIHFFSGTRLGPALGTIRWAPAGPGVPDWLAVDSLDVLVAYPPTPLSGEWWFWGAIAAVLGGAGGVAFRLHQNKKQERDVARRRKAPRPAEKRFQPVGGTASGPASGRYGEGGRPPAASPARPASGPRRSTRSGWRWPPWR